MNLELMRTTLSQRDPNFDLNSHHAHRIIAGHLAVTLAYDSPEGYLHASQDDIDELGLTFDEALVLAKSNMGNVQPSFRNGVTFEQVPGHSFFGPAGEVNDLNSSVILFPELIKTLPINGLPVAFIPGAHMVWITGSEDLDMVGLLAELTVDDLLEGPEKPIGAMALILQQGQWKPWAPPRNHPSYHSARRAYIIDRQRAYAAQKELLDKGDEDDPFAATYSVLDDQHSASTHSVSIWTESVTTLLPRTDYTVLQRLANRQEIETGAATEAIPGDTVVVKWETLQNLCGDQFRPMEMYPERYLVERFPSHLWTILLQEQTKTPAAIRELVSGRGSKPAGYHGTPGQPPRSGSFSGLYWIAGVVCVVLLMGIAATFLITLTRPRVPANAPNFGGDDGLETAMADTHKKLDETRQRFEREMQEAVRQHQQTLQEFERQANSGSGPAAPDIPVLPPCEQSIPRWIVDNASITKGAFDFPPHGDTFEEMGTDGAMLVGLQVSLAENQRLAGLRPIYQAEAEYSLGNWYGTFHGNEPQVLLARPGYAVGEIHTAPPQEPRALKLVYRRVGQNSLEPDDSYESQWVGTDYRNVGPRLNPGSSPILGIHGRVDRGLRAINIIYLDRLPECTTAVRLVSAGDVTMSEVCGNPNRGEFESSAPDGGLLVGMRIYTGISFGGVIEGFQPVYQVGDEYEIGEICGNKRASMEEIIARPGYAVGALEFQRGLVINSMALWFQKLDGDALSPTDSYVSETIGIDDRNSEKLSSNNGPIVGITGTATRHLHSVQLKYLGKAD